MSIFLYFLIITVTSDHNNGVPYPHPRFNCHPEEYDTEFTFLQGSGHGFVHASDERIFFEYYFPIEHWVAFATADQTIEGKTDSCSSCFFDNYYSINENKHANTSNIYPKCIEECLDDAIFVGTVNSVENNLSDWNMIEFQIVAQESKKLQRKMYRIPKPEELLEVWGSTYSPYRLNAHYLAQVVNVDGSEYVHAKFWRKYEFAPNTDSIEHDTSGPNINKWNPFVSGPNGDSFCFITLGSYFGGEYPFDDDVWASEGFVPGFYVDTEQFANIHCYTLDDIKMDCNKDTQTGTLYDKATKKNKRSNMGVIALLVGTLVLCVMYGLCGKRLSKRYTERRQRRVMKRGYYKNEYAENIDINIVEADEEEEEEEYTKTQNQTLLTSP